VGVGGKWSWVNSPLDCRADFHFSVWLVKFWGKSDFGENGWNGNVIVNLQGSGGVVVK